MFRNAHSDADSSILAASLGLQSADPLFLQQYCATDHWMGDIESGRIRLGETSARMHRLDSQDCGLLTLLRTYQREDRAYIIQSLERASSAPSKFCFFTHVVNEFHRLQPVICIGESAGFSDIPSGTMMGLFIFPRFEVDASAH